MKLLKEIRIHDFSINKVTKNILWELDADVNILEGINGSGKTTILEFIYETLRHMNKPENIDHRRLFVRMSKMELFFYDDSVVTIDQQEMVYTNSQLTETNLNEINVDVVRTFDVPNAEKDSLLNTELNKLKTPLNNYQKHLITKMIESLKSVDSDVFNQTKELYKKIDLFTTKINELFKETDKGFDIAQFGYFFNGQNKEDKDYYKDPVSLSSGEKQILYILLKVLLQEEKPTIFLLDEPEISLHITWQRKLIRIIRELNPNCQVIAVTHSTSMFIEGWANKFVRMREIMTNEPFVNVLLQIEQNNQEEDVKLAEFWALYHTNLTNENIKGRLYKFNKLINQHFYQISNYIFDKLIESFGQANADVVTFTTLISKAMNFQSAKSMFEQMPAVIEPNILTFNILIKKAENLEEGKTVLALMEQKKVYPDIITISTLLGKAKNSEEAQEVEELRGYYRVEANELYLNKLKFKK